MTTSIIEDIPDEHDETIDDEAEGDFTFGRRRREPTEASDAPLTNSEAIPLLPNANKKEAREAVAMKVIKLNAPDAGYKGEIHVGADEDYIANMYGDGIYTVEFINSKKKVVRKREGIKIAVGMNNDNPRDRGPDNKEHLDALRLAHISHNLERKRADGMSHSIIDTTRVLAKQHTDMVVESSKASSIRDREFYSGQAVSVQSFFASILQQQQQMAETARQNSEQAHRQQMEASERSNRQMMMMMEAMHSRSDTMNNPMMFLQLFKQGMDMGRDIGGDDSEPWEKAIKTGVEGLGTLAAMQKMSLMTPPPTPKRLPEQRPQPRPKPSQSATISPNPSTQNTDMVLLHEVMELKAVCDKRGVDFEHIIREAKEFLEVATDEELKENADAEQSNNQSSENSVD